MFPVLFSFGPVTIYTFGFLLAVGYFLFAFLCWRRLRDLGLNEEGVIDFLLGLTLFGFIFARGSYILSHWSLFGFSPARWFFLGRFPGFSFWGLIFGGILALVWVCRRKRWHLWRVADEVVFSFLPFSILIYMGYFFSGSLLGVATNSPWGIFFPGDFIRRQPLALFGALFLLLIWFFLLGIERRWRAWDWYKSQAEGLVSLAFLGLVCLVTFLLAFWQEDRLYYLWFKKGSSLLGLTAVLIIFYRRSGLVLNKVLKERLVKYEAKKKKKEKKKDKSD